uniref:ribonuclease H n=1 Tax=Micrurus corallinus TaxID=54390 RepID=A0A2D4FC70_MICCO
MQSLQSILEGIREGDFLTSIDLMEAYRHVPILPFHQKYLRFGYAGHHFQYRVLLFGLSLAPRTFAKLLAALAAYFRAIPMCVPCYLDDILIQSVSYLRPQEDLQTMI